MSPGQDRSSAVRVRGRDRRHAVGKGTVATGTVATSTGMTCILVICAVVICATVVGGCSGDSGSGESGERPASTTADASTDATLPFTSPTKDQIGTEGSLVFPASTADFLTAELTGRQQIDVTFTFATSDREAFEQGSKLMLEDGKRVVLHASPLWKLNPGTAIRGGIDRVSTPDGVKLNRTVELTDESADRTRVRMVLTPTN